MEGVLMEIKCPGCEKFQDKLLLLPCSHKLCSCCLQTWSSFSKCPFCFQPFPANSQFPFVFGRHLKCSDCQKIKDSEDFWFCKDCVALMCSFCSVSRHRNHEILVWGKETVQLIHDQLQGLRQSARDDLGNRAKLRELIGPVLHALGAVLKENAISLHRTTDQLLQVYALAQGDGQPYKSDCNLLQVAQQALAHAGVNDVSVTRRLVGLKCSPEVMAQLIFQHLDFGEGKGETDFIVQTSSPPSRVFFGSHWALLLMWSQKVEIWSLRDREKLSCFHSPNLAELVKAAAICDSPANRVYLLTQADPIWAMVVLDLSSGKQVPNGHFVISADGDVHSGCLGMEESRSMAFIALNFPNRCKLWKLESGSQLSALGHTSDSFVQIAPRSFSTNSFLLAAKLESQPSIHLYLVGSSVVECLNRFSLEDAPLPVSFSWFQLDQLMICQGKQVELWSVDGKAVGACRCLEIQVESKAVLTSVGGRIVAGIPDPDNNQLRVRFFEENEGNRLLPVVEYADFQ